MKTQSLPSQFSQMTVRMALLALTLGPVHRAQAQVVTFADPNLESAVRDALQVYPPTVLYQTNLATLTNLYAAYRGITNLSGLETATNLLALDCGGNPLLSVAPLAGLTSLVELHMAFCQATNPAPVSGLTNLTFLDIGWNRDATDNAIRDTTFLTNLRHLTWLSLYYLRISDLTPLRGLNALTNLNVSYNYSCSNFTALNGLTNLVELYVTAIGLSNITFASHMPSLMKLDVGNNQVTDLSPAVGRNLVALWAYYDPLVNPQLAASFPNLTVLHLDGTSLTNPSFISGLTKLQDCSLDNNPGIINFSFLSGLTNLNYLSLGSDSLVSVTPLAGLYQLTELHLHDDAGLTSITPLASLTNLQHLDLNQVPTVNFGAVTNLANLNYLEINGDGLSAVPFVTAMPRLNRLDMQNNHFSQLTSLAGASLGEVHVANNWLVDLGALPLLTNLYYADVTQNLLDTSATSAAWNIITNLQTIGVSVDYAPQSLSPTITLWDSPADLCLTNGGMAYFAVAASTTTGGSLTYQWQCNGADLAGETNPVLVLDAVSTNQAGVYRAILVDSNGGLASDAAHLYVGDPNCGRTVTIVQQPQNACAAPGADVTFSVAATTTLTNLYYQWLFEGTNIAGTNVSGDTTSSLTLSSVDTNASGFYQVEVWDDSSNTVLSAVVELKVVESVAFVDPSLSNLVFQALLDQTGTAPTLPLALTTLDNLGYLYVGNQGITNLSGLECARNLYALDLSGNTIADPSPLSWLVSVAYLYLNNCGLQDASFVSGLTNLVVLELNQNQIHSIPPTEELSGLQILRLNYNGLLVNLPRLAGLTNLTDLDLHSDLLADISFTAGMPQLLTLDVGGDWIYDGNRNYISDISPLAGKQGLWWLSLSWNQITNIPLVAAFTNLQYLYLSSNHFSNLSFITNLPSLTNEFTLNYSTVTNLAPLAGHPTLNSLDVSYIATSNLDAVSGLTNLTVLWAGGNSVGDASILSNLTRLQYLGFELNGVSNLAPLAGATNLGYLQLENNQINDISLLAAKTNLGSLYLSGNRIHDLTALAGLTNLTSLSLNANGFTNITPLANLKLLNWLVMQSNHVRDISFLAGLTNLQWSLDISANEITDLSPVTNLTALTWLGPWQNRLTSLPPLASLYHLTSIDFWGNQLTNVAGVSGLTNVTWLGLSRNNLATVPPFYGLPNLNSLDLYTNHIVDVSGLAGLTQLNWLNLSDNDLRNIDPLTGLTHLYYVDLTANYLNLAPTSSAMADIATMQSHNTYVNYIPQKAGVLLLAPRRLPGNQFKFAVSGEAGGTVQVWFSTDLATWSSLGWLTNVTGMDTFIDTTATNRARIYRAQSY